MWSRLVASASTRSAILRVPFPFQVAAGDLVTAVRVNTHTRFPSVSLKLLLGFKTAHTLRTVPQIPRSDNSSHNFHAAPHKATISPHIPVMPLMPHSFSKFTSVSARTRVPRAFPQGFSWLLTVLRVPPLHGKDRSRASSQTSLQPITQSSTVANTGPCSHHPTPVHILPHRIPHAFHLLSLLLPLAVSYSYQPSVASGLTPVPPTVCQTHLPVRLLASSQVFCLRLCLSKKNFLSIQIKDFTLGPPLKTCPPPPHCVECIPICNDIFMFCLLCLPPTLGPFGWFILRPGC